jgi:Zn-dependent peptidase ImmA (M78 family)
MDEQGLCNPELREIYINKEYSIEEQRSTLFHEILHACLYEGGVTNVLTTMQEEAVVCCLENGLYPQVGLRKQ